MAAPLDGVSDFSFCKICLDGGADIVYTEMTSANDLYFESKNLIEYLKLFKGLHRVGIQLYGKDPEKFIKASQVATELGFDEINVNFGCPAKGVTSSGGGVMHMRDLDNMHAIISNIIKGTHLPVSIKIRAGVNVESITKHQLEIPQSTLDFIEDKTKITALDLLRKIKDLPLSSIVIHGRTYENLFSGEVDYDLIKKCKEFVGSNFINSKELNDIFPVLITNGGILDEATSQNTLKRTNSDGLMIGRGLYGKPFIFKQLNGFKDINVKEFILNHAMYLWQSKPHKAHLDFRKHLLWYVASNNYSSEIRKDIVSIENLDDVKNIVDKLM